MSHPDPCYDPDNSYEDDYMEYHDDTADAIYDNYDDTMDGDHDSVMTSCGWGIDEDYGHYPEDEYGDWGDDY